MNISIIGIGNVGSALAIRLHQKGHRIVQLFSRDHEKAAKLAQEVDAQPCSKLHNILPGADIYILAVHDDAIAKVAQAISVGDALVVHSSGATPLDVFEGIVANYGVFYPLQTFSPAYPPDFSELPICISANKPENLQCLVDLAKTICPNVYTITEAQRQALHVAAVFVNNFTNHLFSIAHEICDQEEVDFNILKPLIRQTVRKIEQSVPSTVQTGPAARGDEGTITRHFKWLDQNRLDYEAIYQILTNSILKTKSDEKGE
jgi:predicted short-subunit dehydrogenase-like oxidoreductase (DUF2520 family)